MANGLLMFIVLDADSTASLSLVISVIGLVVSSISAVAAIAAAVFSRRALGTNEPAPVEKKTKPPKRASNRLYDIDIPTSPREEQHVPQAPAPAEAPIPTQIVPQGPPAVEAPTPTQIVTQAPAEVPIQVPTPVPPEIPASAPVQVEIPTPSQTQTPVQTPKQAPAPAQPQSPHIPISVDGEAMGEVPLELRLTVQDPSIRVSRVERLNQVGKPLGATPCKPTEKPLVFKSILAPDKVTQWWSTGETASEGGAKNILRVYLLLDQSKKEIYRDVPVSITEDLRNVGIASLVFWTVKGSI